MRKVIKVPTLCSQIKDERRECRLKPATRRRLRIVCLLAALGTLDLTARADGAAPGRKLFGEVCKPCHGRIDERRAGDWPRGRFIPVVALPLGPDLTGVYGRPAGVVSGFDYSTAFRAVASDFVWNDETLDRWLADSQAMIRGSYMRIKVKAPARHNIIEYLETFSRYRK